MNAVASKAGPDTPVRRSMPPPPPGSFAPGRRPLERHGLLHAPDCDDGAGHGPKEVVSIAPAEFVTRRRATWPGAAVETIDVTRQGRLEFRFNSTMHLLIVFESGSRSEGCTSVEGLPRSKLREYGRKLIFVPAGHEYVDWHETRSLPRLACYYFDPMEMSLDSQAPLSPRLFFEDPELLKTALKLKAAVDGSEPYDRAYCEALALVLAHDLVRLGRGAPDSKGQHRGGLAGWQQHAVARFIDERLAERVSLRTLAALARLSPCHFARAFKQSFGVPPHRFHTHRRIERAKALLANPEMSATEIGIAIGFSSASSFTMSFRKVTGTTPTGFRRTVI